MIKNIVLDWHGVLDLNSPMMLRKEFIKVFFKLLFTFNLSQAWHILAFGFDSYSKDIEDYSSNLMPPKDFWERIAKKTDPKVSNQIKKALMEIKPNLDLEKHLKSLSKKHRLYILSDCPLDKKILIEKRLPDLVFQKKFYSCDYKTTKRQKKFFQIFLEDTQLNPKETLFVDDSKKNIEIAKEFGLQTLWYKTNQSANQIFSKLS